LNGLRSCRRQQPIGIVSLVADEGTRVGVFEQWFGASQVVVLPRRQHQVAGIAQGVDERVDFGRQAATRTPHALGSSVVPSLG